jgi:cell division septation protein DedD
MRDWEATLIDLWQQSLEIAAIAQRLGVPYGTIQSRAHRLQREGKIQPRGRGGAYPRRRALARQAETPAPPVPPTAPAAPALPAPPVTPATPTTHAPPVVPAPPAPERKEIQQWTIRLSKALIEHLKAVAYERRMHPSELVEDWLWQQAHTDQPS